MSVESFPPELKELFEHSQNIIKRISAGSNDEAALKKEIDLFLESKMEHFRDDFLDLTAVREFDRIEEKLEFILSINQATLATCIINDSSIASCAKQFLTHLVRPTHVNQLIQAKLYSQLYEIYTLDELKKVSGEKQAKRAKLLSKFALSGLPDDSPCFETIKSALSSLEELVRQGEDVLPQLQSRINNFNIRDTLSQLLASIDSPTRQSPSVSSKRRLSVNSSNNGESSRTKVARRLIPASIRTNMDSATETPMPDSNDRKNVELWEVDDNNGNNGGVEQEVQQDEQKPQSNDQAVESEIEEEPQQNDDNDSEYVQSENENQGGEGEPEEQAEEQRNEYTRTQPRLEGLDAEFERTEQRPAIKPRRVAKKWTEPQVQALADGLRFFQNTRWAEIAKRYPVLRGRTGNDLKDKARNEYDRLRKLGLDPYPFSISKMYSRSPDGE